MTHYIYPNQIKKEDLPLIVFSDHSSGLVQWLIKWRTKANYNHVMIMHKPGYFASQGNVFSEAKLKRYMTKHSRLKFVRFIGLRNDNRKRILKAINDDLKLSFWKRMYDYLGILGQAVGIKRINMPNKYYCSERTAKYMKIIDKDVPVHESPKGLNEYCKKSNKYGLYGRWSAD